MGLSFVAWRKIMKTTSCKNYIDPLVSVQEFIFQLQPAKMLDMFFKRKSFIDPTLIRTFYDITEHNDSYFKSCANKYQ